MKGRIFGIKKSFFLWVSAIILFLLFLTLDIVLALFLKIPVLWFYSFCLCLGIYELIKSILFRLDSAVYSGSLLSLIGTSGFVFWLTNTSHFALVYILVAFSLSSFITFILCKQTFHLILSYSLFFVSAYSYILIKSLISLPIFIAFICSFLVLLFMEIIFYIKRR